ncbi:hypothetical protein [Myceligenerans pegani]|uniref:Uncharacterized protein n=1 Tax=Myceligenerans pegani TaxID=2776917 RepID=A0ABR9MSV8_9MICO|nr:hypothetical protein [Myceligenerans sp. TRM 65318]MBE1874456.1 hypothetical protein [Myceligenerans sp. TRM 65318]MBE3016727.1 hypothetical protein [Myceligenerans sp. TRM 65318]
MAGKIDPAPLSDEARELAFDDGSLAGLFAHAEKQPEGSLPGVEGQAPVAVADLAMYLRTGYQAMFGDVEWDAANERVTIWWHGTPPKKVAERVADLGVPAEFKSMRYSRQKLEVEAKRLLAAGGDTFETIAVKTDGTGLEATVSDQQDKAQATTDTDLASAYPLEIDVVDGGVMTAASPDDRKYTPYVPYAGGANIIHESGVTGCSTGWPVMIDAPHSSRPRNYGMLFADHCIDGQPDQNDDIWATYPDPQDNNNSYFYGATSSYMYRSHDQDVAIMVNMPNWTGIENPNMLYFPYVYVGPHVNASRYIVTASRVAVIGENWCLGGAFSGTNCGNQVTSTAVYYNGEHGQVGPMVRTVNPTQSGAGQGDSGGPVHTITIDYPYAQVGGIISAIEPPFDSCRANDDGRLCSHTVLSSQYWSIQDNGLAIRAMTASNYDEDM